MKKLWVFLTGIFLFLLLASWQESKKSENYNYLWEKVRQYSQKDLPGSALKTVQLIYAKAKEDGNETQIVKSLLYRISLQSRFQESFRLKSIREFEREIKTAAPVEKALLSSLLGQLCQSYFDAHFDKILNRKTPAVADTSLETLNAGQWNLKIKNAYLASVSSPATLSRVSLSGFSAVLQKSDSSAYALWPTLYDLLAHRAINYFSSGDARLAFSVQSMPVDTNLLAPAARFLKINFSPDTSTATGRILVLFQHLLRLHKAGHQARAFVDVDLKRLRFVREQLPDNLANNLAYVHALKNLWQQYKNQEISVRIVSRLAQVLRELPVIHPQKINYLIEAENLCKNALKAFPSSAYANNCKNLITKINQPFVQIKMPQALLPDRPFLALITYKNNSRLFFKVIKNSPDIENPAAGENLRRKLINELKSPAFTSWGQSVPFVADHLVHTAEIAMPALPVGSYVIFVSNDPHFSEKSTVLYQQIQVTQLALLSRKNNSARALDIYLLDRADGTPVSGATVTIYGRSYDYRAHQQSITALGTSVTNANGFLQIPLGGDNEYNGFILKANKGIDTTYVNTYARFYGSVYRKNPVLHTYLFTDRAIYRPGQTVYFKGIVVESKGNNAHVKAGVKQDVQLLNAQYKKLDDQHMVSNAAGSFSGSFVLPDVALNGQFILRTATGMTSIRMENYKRPAFYVVFNPLKKGFSLNQKVTLTGKVAYYFGGVPAGIPVKYTVERESYFPFPFYVEWYPGQTSQTPVAGGTVHTDSAGRFRITFQALADKNIPGDAWPVYRFVVHVEATDASGESHVATREIRISRLAVLLKLQVSPKVMREQSHGVKLMAQNISGNEVPAKVRIKLYRLTPPDNYFLRLPWPKPDTILINKARFIEKFPHIAYGNENDKNKWKKTLLASEMVDVNGEARVFTQKIKKLKPGEYLVQATVTGQPEVPVKKFFTLSSERSSKLPVKEIFWTSLSSEKAEPGDVLQLRVGSASGYLRMFYEVLNGREVVQRQWITVGKKLTKLEIPVAGSFRGNFAIRLMAVKDNRFFSWSRTVKVPFTNKKLVISLQTSRNYLQPGGKEQWTLQVKSVLGKTQPAFLLAGMYDASLDVFAANRWKMFPYHSKTPGFYWHAHLFTTGYPGTLFRKQIHLLHEPATSYPQVNWFGYPLFSTENFGVVMGATRQKAMPVITSVQPSVSAVAEKKEYRAPSSVLPPEKKKPRQTLRTNFNETAFFYPNLVTDSNGVVRFSFTTPDALTQWKFMALAYTKDMKTGSYVQKFTARKELMVIPNLPRFVRQGDKLVFTARVSNLSGKKLPVRVKLAFFNPENNKKLSLFLNHHPADRQVTVLPGKNALVSWLIYVPKNIQFMAYRIKAVSGNLSDGEERMIPVLGSRELITESLPLFINGNKQKTFVFHHFLEDTSVTRRNFRYTLTFTSHPAWYAIQALPYLDKPEYQSVENLFYRFYARALAGNLLRKYPRIRQVFAQWKQQNQDVFLSVLQKDQSLKDIVLQATPWLLEARNETEQKRRIALFFNINQMQRKQQSAFNRLQAAQLPSGAWPWFPGMPSDFFTTEHILSGLADLVEMKSIGPQQKVVLHAVLEKGLDYLDNKMVQEYHRILKQYPKTKGKDHLNSGQIRYCYLRSGLLSDFPLGKNAQQAFAFFSGQIKQYWPRLDNDMQALSAMTLNRLGWGNQAEAIIRALNEKALLNKENGMYWRSNPHDFNVMSAVSTEVDIMKAFVEVMHDTRAADKMKTWLIMQKQANHWQGVKATADAVYALLMNGSPLLSETRPVVITLGNGQKIPEKNLQKEAGTGFFKKIWNDGQITSALGKLTVDNPNKGMAYGAAYWQYFENISKVARYATDVSIQKMLFKEIITPKGNKWVRLSGNIPLKTGDRILVRLLIRSARAVDFVHVQDFRAAAFEPEKLLSAYERKGGLAYYEEIRDASTDFFIRHLPKGTFMLEYPLLVTQKGVFSNGMARIQSLYLPSYVAHSSGGKIQVQ